MYTSYADILSKCFISGDSAVTAVVTTLSGFVVDAGGDKFTFSGGAPLVGDVLYQAGYAAEIIDVSGAVLQINTTGTLTKIVVGAAKVLHSDSLPKALVDQQILLAQEFIEQHTRQWFEPRSKTIRVEGKNSNVMLLRVPIISVSEIRLNDDATAQDLVNFELYTGVDNRRNPRIKIRSGSRNIFTGTVGRTFHRAAYSEIDGSFGFVEEDGSTPLLIAKAASILALDYIKSPATVSLGGVGPLKREKTDLHETEYFQPDDVTGASTGAISGNIEVDRIINMYRGPTGIGGSIMDLARIEDSDRQDFDRYDVY
jgi:hypothetical protein